VSLNSSEKKSTNLPPARAPSTVWQHYERIYDNEGVHIHTKCNYCDQKYSIKCSTTTLNDHWKKKHLKIQPGKVGSIEAAFDNARSQTKLQSVKHGARNRNYPKLFRFRIYRNLTLGFAFIFRIPNPDPKLIYRNVPETFFIIIYLILAKFYYNIIIYYNNLILNSREMERILLMVSGANFKNVISSHLSIQIMRFLYHWIG
jgi:hypothetical protein